MADPHMTIGPKDPRMAKLLELAETLLDEARTMAEGYSQPGAEKLQAFHFAATAIMNKSGLGHLNTALALGTVVGMAYATAQLDQGQELAAEFNAAFNEQVPISVQDILDRHMGGSA